MKENLFFHKANFIFCAAGAPYGEYLKVGIGCHWLLLEGIDMIGEGE